MKAASQCVYCKHLLGYNSCTAFPNSLPREIFILQKHNHVLEYPGDNGIRFEPRDDAPDWTKTMWLIPTRGIL